MQIIFLCLALLSLSLQAESLKKEAPQDWTVGDLTKGFSMEFNKLTIEKGTVGSFFHAGIRCEVHMKQKSTAKRVLDREVEFKPPKNEKREGGGHHTVFTAKDKTVDRLICWRTSKYDHTPSPITRYSVQSMKACLNCSKIYLHPDQVAKRELLPRNSRQYISTPRPRTH